jgi:hypothetical protein
MAKESQGIIAYIATTTVVSTNIAVGEVVGFSGPSLTANVIDVTNLGSTAKEKLVGVYDGGQITLNCNCLVTDSGQTKAREMLAARTKGSLMIQLSSAATTQKINLEGFVVGLNITGAVDAKLAADLTWAVTGGASFST